MTWERKTDKYPAWTIDWKVVDADLRSDGAVVLVIERETDTGPVQTHRVYRLLTESDEVL